MFVCKNFVVCSFVARPMEHSSEGVLKVPFYHSNIDYDEVLFYHEGNFFSRDNIDSGAITFHPQGIHHGPHPKAFAKADDKEWTDEYAVMIDTRYPLKRSEAFECHKTCYSFGKKCISNSSISIYTHFTKWIKFCNIIAYRNQIINFSKRSSKIISI